MDLVGFPRRDEVWLVRLDPSLGSEIKKTRPCLVVSPDEMNEFLMTVLVAPMTSTVRDYASRVTVNFRGTTGQIALDQIRAVDRERLTRRLGAIPLPKARDVASVLIEMFTR